MIRLYDQASGRELGAIEEDELAFLRKHLEEESLADRDYWIDPATIDLLATRGASPHLVALLREAVREDENGIDIEVEREGEPRRPLRST